MDLQFSVFALPLALTAVACAGTAWLIWSNLLDGDRGAGLTANHAQVLVLVLIAIWSVGQLLTVSTTTVWLKYFGMSLTASATQWTAAVWLVFALLYTGREQLVTRRTLSLLAVIPTVTTILVATNTSHGLMMDHTVATGTGSFSFPRGPGFWIGAIHNWVLGVFTIWMLFEKFRASRNLYRKISFFHIVGGIALNGGAFISMNGWSPFPNLVLGATLFSLIAALSAVAVINRRIMNAIPLERLLSLFGNRWQSLAPMARDTIVHTMQSGVLVLDEDNNIVDVNPIGKRMIGAEDRRVVGKSLTEVVPREVFDSPDTSFLDPETIEGEYRGVWVETADGARYCFDLQVTGLGSDSTASGRTMLIKDVTERELRKSRLEAQTEELERQNEQLEQFAGVVSHDLRNPLNVAKGHLEVAKAKAAGDQTALDEIEVSHSRMEAIIEDVLTLARQGKSIGETEPIQLDSIARDAWEHVDTPSMNLEIDAECEIEADYDRLLNLFENLYRNAREHAGDDATVTVGTEQNTFFVADDGPGIPEEQREEVLESGFTTEETGTGFGLAIVSQVADAHGWEVTVTESDTGGARFEFATELREHPGTPAMP